MTGLDRLRSFLDGRFPHPAAYQTIGMHPLRIDHGDIEYGLDATGWLAGRDGMVAPAAIAYFLDAPVTNAVQTMLEGGVPIRTVRLSIDFHAPVPPGAGPFNALGTVEGLREGVGIGASRLEDADGTLLATSTCRTVNLDPRDFRPPPDEAFPEPVPGPAMLEAPAVLYDADESGLAYLERLLDGADQPPIWALFGTHVSEAEPGRAVLATAADAWLGTHAGILYGGATAAFGSAAAEAAMWAGDGPAEHTRMLSYTHDFTRMVGLDEPVVVADAHLVHRGRTLAIAEVELRDSEGRRVGLGRGTGLVATRT